MRRVCAILLIPVIASLAASCASSPPVRYYGLEPIASAADSGSDNVHIGLGPIAFPEYLRRPQIVTRSAGAELKVAEFDRWAEPVEDAFLRTVVTDVDALLDSAVVVAFPYSMSFRIDYRILGRVMRFDVDETGTAVLNVQWAAATPDGQEILGVRRSTYTARAASRDSYDSIVTALNETVEAFSRDVADQLRVVLEE
jgi:uncharacterized lipoprotein YmbA